jgi:hypothetical protein
MDSWSSNAECDEDMDGAMLRPAIIGSYKDEYGDSKLLQANHAFSEAEAYSVQALAECVREYMADHAYYRPFQIGGGNKVVYMASLLQKFIPGVASQLSSLLHMAHSEVGISNNPPSSSWTHPRSESGQKRTCRTRNFKKDYEGGHFFLDRLDFGEVLFKPPRLSALVFLRDFTRGVNST